MAGETQTEATATKSFLVFQPPAGGDLALRSSDGTTFHVHSVLLGLASTVFSDMLTGNTKSDTVELAEDAETVSLMLAFIYPVDPPSITTVDQLERVMQSSHKYDIERMIKFVEGCNRPDNQLILSNPLRVFRASIKHDFPAIQKLSAKASGAKHLDPCSLQGLEGLAKNFPEASPVIGLIGAQLVRRQLLANWLKAPSIESALMPIVGYSERWPESLCMACNQCWAKTRLRSNPDRYIPGWMPLWLTRLHDRLIEKPMDSCEDFLSLLFIADLCESKPESICSDCIKLTLASRSVYEQWARNTKRFVDRELLALEKLYSF